jgi:hypothetical protein
MLAMEYYYVNLVYYQENKGFIKNIRITSNNDYGNGGSIAVVNSNLIVIAYCTYNQDISMIGYDSTGTQVWTVS